MTMERKTFQHAGNTLETDLFMPPSGTPPFAGVLFFPGMTGSRSKYSQFAEALAEKGMAAMTVSIRGHEGSSGDVENTTAAEFETDGIAAYDFFVKQDGIDPRRIGICGGSFGGLIAAVTSEVRPVKSIVMRAPAAYTPEMRQEKMGDILARETHVFNDISNVEGTAAIRAITEFRGSLLVIACENDDHIPLAIPQAYFDNAKLAARKEFEILKGAEHSLQTNALRTQFTDRLVRWFPETL
ncbi:MAG: alpha/beta fold hydrolase [Candidatus Paceibacterota bacterium]